EPYRLDSNLRLGPEYAPWAPQTHFQFPDDHGSFAHAALRCVGVGKCRRYGSDEPDDDIMCPSYMATLEEKHSTRGRAHLLWEMLHGYAAAPGVAHVDAGDSPARRGPVRDGWRDDAVKEALDLCLSCKGCKGECPVNVDIATYKAEFLAHYYEHRLRPIQAYTMGWIHWWSRLAEFAPGLANLFMSLPITKTLGGIARER